MNDLNNLKDSLSQTKEDLKRALEKDLESIQTDLGQVAKVAGIVAGVGIASYLILRKVFRKKNTAVSDSSSLPVATARESVIVRMIKEQISIFVAALLRKKLQELLLKLKLLDADEDS